MYRSAAEALPSLEKLARYREEAGRGQANFGIEARFAYGAGDPGLWLSTLESWQEAGATHISFNTMGHGFDTPAKHLRANRQLAEADRASTAQPAS